MQSVMVGLGIEVSTTPRINQWQRIRAGELELDESENIVTKVFDFLVNRTNPEYLTGASLPLSEVVTWLSIAISFTGVGIVMLMASYYPTAFFRWTETSFLWTERYRKIRGTDHTGIWLEVVFTILLAVNLFGLATAAYPGAAHEMLAWGPVTWLTLTVMGVIALLIIGRNFSDTHQSALLDDIRKCRPDIQVKLRRQTAADLGKPVENVTEAEFEQRWEDEATQVTRIYNCYAFYSVIAWWLLFISFLLFGRGAVAQFNTSRIATQELVRLNNDIVTGDGTRAFGTKEQHKCEQLVRTFFSFREVLLLAVQKFLLSIALFSLLFSWFLGTRFQDLYAPTTRNVFRCIACFFLLFLLPGMLLYGYVHFVRTAATVNDTFHRLDNQLAENIDLGEIKAFNEVRQRMVAEASVGSFAASVFSSWGSILMLLQIVASRIGVTRVRENLLPDFAAMEAAKLRVKLFFTDPRDDHSADPSSDQAEDGP